MVPVLRKRLHSEDSLTLHSSLEAPDTRLCAAITAVPKFRSPGLPPRTSARHVLEDALPLLSNSFPILAHVPLQTVTREFSILIVVSGSCTPPGCFRNRRRSMPHPLYLPCRFAWPTPLYITIILPTRIYLLVGMTGTPRRTSCSTRAHRLCSLASPLSPTS